MHKSFEVKQYLVKVKEPSPLSLPPLRYHFIGLTLSCVGPLSACNLGKAAFLSLTSLFLCHPLPSIVVC